jgi:hypothetical protein
MHVSDRLDKWSWFRRDSLGRVDRTIMPRRKDSRIPQKHHGRPISPSGERQLWGQTYPFRGEGAKSGFGAEETAAAEISDGPFSAEKPDV